MATLAALADRATITRAGHECGIAFAYRVLGDTDATALRAAIANPTVKHFEITTALAEVGIDVRIDTVGRHRLTHCRCTA